MSRIHRHQWRPPRRDDKAQAKQSVLGLKTSKGFQTAMPWVDDESDAPPPVASSGIHSEETTTTKRKPNNAIVKACSAPGRR
ncbi:hypothetical protein MY10362_000310 [Beauveria mimosiformis]